MESLEDVMFAQIRDEYGDVESVGLVNTTAEAVLWFRERGIDFADVKSSDNGYQTVFEVSR